MKQIYCLLFTFAAIVILSCTILKAQTSGHTISYQGMITSEKTTEPISGVLPIIVTIYGDEAGTNRLWEGIYKTKVTNGVFQIQLGSGDFPLPELKTFDRQLWIGITVNNGDELRPLSVVGAVPLALSVPDRSITKEKLNADYVSAIKLDGHQIIDAGRSLNLKSGPGMMMTFDRLTSSLTLTATGGAVTVFSQGISFNPCGTNNDGGGTPNTNYIGGGCANTTNNLGTVPAFASVVGGFRNHAYADFSAVVGGDSNAVYSKYGFIGAGSFNLVGSTNPACGAFIGAGGVIDCDGNFSGNTADSHSSGIVAGHSNATTGNYAFIGAGHDNAAGGESSVIGGGANNSTVNSNDAIVGGSNNTASGGSSFIGAGSSNQALGNSSVIGGGSSNRTPGLTSTIAGGTQDTASGSLSFIGGGSGNTSGGTKSVVGGGEQNKALGQFSAVVGGHFNTTIGFPPPNGAEYAFIGGGLRNTITDNAGTIGGGTKNIVGDNVSLATRVGLAGSPPQTLKGISTIANDAQFSTIAGGFSNLVAGSESVIGGGDSNISANRRTSQIGGAKNLIFSDVSTIGGGEENQIQIVSTGINRSTLTPLCYLQMKKASRFEMEEEEEGMPGGIPEEEEITLPCDALYATITGGLRHLIFDSKFAFIGAGNLNTIGGVTTIGAVGAPTPPMETPPVGNASNAVITGGENNTIAANSGTADYSAIVGGRNNAIAVNSGNAWYSFIGSGADNNIGSNVAAAHYGVITGGKNNSITSVGPAITHAAIVGGSNNTVSSTGAFSGAGTSNTNSGNNAVIGGGQLNSTTANNAVIGGGFNNLSSGRQSVVGGGSNNSATDTNAFVGGGKQNAAMARYAAIGGGTNDSAKGHYSAIMGGELNQSTGSHSFIGGGFKDSAAGAYSVIGGGFKNWNLSDASTIGGGKENKISTSDSATIGGGRSNTIAASDDGTIGGGHVNLISYHPYGTIGGGDSNALVGSDSESFIYSTISGGVKNKIEGSASAIAGGRYLQLANNSFGFNGDKNNYAFTDLTNNDNIAYFGDVDVWIGNVDDRARSLLFFLPNSNMDYVDLANADGLSLHTGFKAPDAIDNSMVYILPSILPGNGDNTPGSFLVSDASGVLHWLDSINLNTVGFSGTLPVTNGGLGVDSITKYGIPYGLGIGQSAIGVVPTALATAGMVLTYNGLSAPPSWSSIVMTAFTRNSATGSTDAVDLSVTTGTPEVAGKLKISNGGLGKDNIMRNGVLYGNGSTDSIGVVDTLTATTGDLLSYDISGGPKWITPPPVNSVYFSNVLSGVNNADTLVVGTNSVVKAQSNGIIIANQFVGSSSSNALVELDNTTEITGEVHVSNGGTGLSTVAANDILIGSGGDTLGVISASTGATGRVLTFSASGPPTWVPPTPGGSILFSNVLTATKTTDTLTVSSGGGTVAAIMLANSGIIESNRFLGAGSISTAVDLTTNEVSGTLSISKGGTGATLTVLTGDLLVGIINDSIGTLSSGTTNANKVLAVTSTGGPIWQSPTIVGRLEVPIAGSNATDTASITDTIQTIFSSSGKTINNCSYYQLKSNWSSNQVRRFTMSDVQVSSTSILKDGQMLTIQNMGPKKFKVIAKSAMKLNPRSNKTLAPMDCITVIWDAGSGKWLELSPVR